MKLLINHITKLFIILLFLQSFSFAQEDSVKNHSGSASDTIFVMHKSPWGAVLRSAVIPGWGQIYNESYIKAPIIWGIFGGIAAGWIFYNKKYNDSQSLYLQTKDARYIEVRNFYRDQRDLMSIYLGLAYFLNLVDAYVDAQLFDFSVKEDYRTGLNMLNIRVKF